MSQQSIEHTESATLREEVFHTTLPSGLRVSFCPKPGFQKKYASYSAFYGSVDNWLANGERVPDGIAHFLEHCLFETEEGNVSDLFALNGAYNNAMTSFTTTTYLFAASEMFYENLELLVRFVETPAFVAEKVDKERGIIEQEIKGYDDSPDWVSYTGILEGLFREHPIRIDIAGSVESIQPIDVDWLQRCYDQFYHPSNLRLFVVGDLDRDELFDRLSTLSRPRKRELAHWDRVYPKEPREVAERTQRLEMDVALPKLVLGFKDIGVPQTGRAYVRQELARQIALDMLFGASSDAYRDLYRSRLILDDFYAYYGAGAGIGYAMLGGDAPEPERLEAEILAKIDGMRSSGISADDFAREKRRFTGSFIRGFNSLEYIANNYTAYRFLDFDLFETIDVLTSLELSDVEESIETLLDPACAASFIIVPKG